MYLSTDHQIDTPGFSPGTSVQVKGNQVLISSSEKYVVLEGEMSGELVRVIQDGCSMDEIITSLGSRYPPAELYFLVIRLLEDGYLVDLKGLQAVPYADYWSKTGYNPGSVARAFEKHHISILQLGFGEATSVRDVISNLGIKVTQGAERVLVLTTSYLHPGLAGMNENALNAEVPFMLAKPVGPEIWIGPVIDPGKTACWECIKHRLELNRPDQVFHSEKSSTIRSVSPDPDAVVQLAHGMIAMEVAKWLASSESPALMEKIVSFDLRTLESRTHQVVKRPQCRVCGSRENAYQRHQIFLSSSPVVRDNNYRVCSTTDTIAKFQHHVSPISGVVRSLVRVRGEAR